MPNKVRCVGVGEDLEKSIQRNMEFVAQVKGRSEGALQTQTLLTKYCPQSVQ